MSAQNISVMSFNIRWLNDEYDQGTRHWNTRKAAVVEIILKYSPDVLCLQEAVLAQVEGLASELTTYQYYAVYRDGKSEGESCAIFYNPKVVSKISERTFWLSERPETPSLSWGAMYERMCSVVQFRLIAGEAKLTVANTHFDHKSRQASQNSANLVIKELKPIAENGLLLLLGDFNLARHSPTYNQFLAEGYRDLSQEPEIMAKTNPKWVTSHGFRGTTSTHLLSNNRFCIDWILFKHLRPLSYSVCFDKPNGIYASDHWPILGTFMVQ
jgi:endonuclease/exonuclease/phosphatase family metal-dependent hydrolase